MERGAINGESLKGKYVFAQRGMDTGARALSSIAGLRKQSVQPSAKPPVFDLFVVIDKRPRERESFVLCLQHQCPGSRVVGYESVAEWRENDAGTSTNQIILNSIGSQSLTDENVKNEARKLVAEAKSVPVIILGASDDVDSVIAALECGAIGYIPPCIRFAHIEEAASLAMVGGIFLSRKSVFALRNVVPSLGTGDTSVLDQFTTRQLTVAQVLRRGAANKTIAYELSLRESTVKVHVRQIFKKLKATNRTQAAFLLNQMTGWPEETPDAKA